MAVQLLDNLLGLQVPDIDQAVLTARHDPLAARDGEVGENAVLFVLVARVGLETLALAVELKYVLTKLIQQKCSESTYL